MRIYQGWLIPESRIERLFIKRNSGCMRPWGYGYLSGTVKDGWYTNPIPHSFLTLIDYLASRSLIYIHPLAIVPCLNCIYRMKNRIKKLSTGKKV